MAVAVAVSPAWAADTDGDGVDAGDCQPNNALAFPGAPDKPDVNFDDTNCDGVDGDLAKAVFVATSGNDAATGTKENPLQTVQAGINRAEAEGKDVYLAGGTYSEPGGADLADNVGIYGGYGPVTGSRSNAETTTIQGSPQAVLADGDTGVVLQLLTLNATADAARSAYGARAINDSTVVLQKGHHERG
jgi:hypothetical protein